jgi:hypothetical protein
VQRSTQMHQSKTLAISSTDISYRDRRCDLISSLLR